MQSTLQLIAKQTGELTQLRSPEVGLFTCALPEGALLGPGQVAGFILCLGRKSELLVPPGVHGRISSASPSRTQAPVGYGEVLYELSPVDGAGAMSLEADTQASDSGLILRSTQSGRFYHRPSPDEPNYANPGDELTEGNAIGLVEIMKTFSQVSYHQDAGLPARAKLVRFLVDDGAEVREGDGLIEVEPV